MSEHRIQCNGDSIPGAPNCGIVTLTPEQYAWNLSKPDYPWCCPHCGSTAEYVEPEEDDGDYSYYEAMDDHRREVEFVERSLGDSVICQDCGATLATFADKCSAGLLDQCAGFLAIDRAKQAFHAEPATPEPHTDAAVQPQATAERTQG